MEHDLVLDKRRIGIRDRMMGDYEVMMMSIFAESGMEHIDYRDYDSLSQEQAEDRIYKDEWDWLASPAWVTIRGHIRFIPPGKTPAIRTSDRKAPQYGGTTAKELEEFKEVVISDLLFDVVCVKALKKNRGAADILPAESELLLGFQDALRNYNWSSAFIFSLKLYVDIRNILEDTVIHAFQQLEQTAHKIDSGLPLQIEWATGPRRELRHSLRQRQKAVERFMLNDVVLEDKLPRYVQGLGMDREDAEDFYLLKHEPVWAGLLDFRAKLFMSELGHEFVHRSFLVEAAAYLYAAARAASTRFPEHHDLPVWADMEEFLDSYTDESALKRGILSGGDDPVAILRNFRAVLPADLIQPKPQNVALDAAPDQTNTFRQSVRIRQLLSKRYTSENRTSQFFMQYMAGLIQQRLEPEMEQLEAEDVSTALRDLSNSKPSAQPHMKSGLREERRAMAEQRVSLRDRQRATRRKALLAQLSPIQQIQTLEDTVTSQLEGLLSIDFMDLYYTSWRVLNVVDMEEDRWRNKMREDSQLEPKRDRTTTSDERMIEMSALMERA